MPPTPHLAKRAGWGIADQALSSLTNLALGIVVARSVTTDDFGAFSLAFATYLLVMGVTRAVAAQPLVIRYATCSPDQWREATGRSVGSALVIGLAAAAGSVVVALVAAGPVRETFLALALTFPGLMMQDTWRFAFFAKSDERSAFANDLVWAMLLLGPLVFVLARGDVSVFTATVGWGAAATAAAAYGVVQAGTAPRMREARAWWREHRGLIPAYVGEFGATAGAEHLSLFAIGGVANLAVVGALRAAEIVLGPVRSLFQGVRQVAQPEAVRIVATQRHLVRSAALLSLGLAGIAVIGGIALLLLPDAVGQSLLRDTWFEAKPVLLPTALAVAGSGALVGAQMGLHALVAVRRTLSSRVILSAMLVVFKVGGATVGGAVGAASGGALAMAAGAALWWWQFVTAYRSSPFKAGTGLAEKDYVEPNRRRTH